MRTRLFFHFMLFLHFGIVATAWSQSTVYSYLSSGQIYKTDPVTCTSTLLCTQTAPVILHDIAWSNGVIYGITAQLPLGQLYAFDTLTGNLNFITNTVASHGLASDGLGNLFLVYVDGDLYKYNIGTNTIMCFGPVGKCSGDLAFKDDTLFLINDWMILVRITLNPFGYTNIDTIDFGVPTSSVHSFGLAFIHTQEIHSLVASVRINGVNKHYLVNSADATATLLCPSIPGADIYGMTSIPIPMGLPEEDSPAVLFSLWPDPADHYLVVETSPGLAGRCHITLQTIQGRQLLSETFGNAGQLTLDLSPLGSGIYLLTLQNGRQRATRKFVVQK